MEKQTNIDNILDEIEDLEKYLDICKDRLANQVFWFKTSLYSLLAGIVTFFGGILGGLGMLGLLGMSVSALAITGAIGSGISKFKTKKELEEVNQILDEKQNTYEKMEAEILDKTNEIENSNSSKNISKTKATEYEKINLEDVKSDKTNYDIKNNKDTDNKEKTI